MKKLYLLMCLFLFVFMQGAPLHEVFHTHGVESQSASQEGFFIEEEAHGHDHCEACSGCAHSAEISAQPLGLVSKTEGNNLYPPFFPKKYISKYIYKIKHPPTA